MSRAIWKGIPNGGKRNNRRNMILPEWIGKIMRISDGKAYKEVKISGEMVGRRVGQLVRTKKRPSYKKKNEK